VEKNNKKTNFNTANTESSDSSPRNEFNVFPGQMGRTLPAPSQLYKPYRSRLNVGFIHIEIMKIGVLHLLYQKIISSSLSDAKYVDMNINYVRAYYY